MSNYPKDIYPESRNRLPTPQREELDDLGKRIYDETTGASPLNIAGLQGPGGIWLHNPPLAERHRALNHAVRSSKELGPTLTELAILVTARAVSHQFEWTVHEPVARAKGLSAKAIDIVKHRLPIEGLTEQESTIIRLGREALEDRKLSSQTYADAERLFGRPGLVALTALMAGYASTAVMLTVFDQQLPADKPPLLPLP